MACQGHRAPLAWPAPRVSEGGFEKRLGGYVNSARLLEGGELWLVGAEPPTEGARLLPHAERCPGWLPGDLP